MLEFETKKRLCFEIENSVDQFSIYNVRAEIGENRGFAENLVRTDPHGGFEKIALPSSYSQPNYSETTKLV